MYILVSRCLLGEPCRYDGKSKPVPQVKQLEEQGHILVPVCPEVMGGLKTPRSPAERQPEGRVVNRDGEDVSLQYVSGAQKTLELAKRYGCTCAVLKAKSPSCGNLQIYDGSFAGRLVQGQGVTAQMLEEAGVRAWNVDQLECIEFIK